MRAGRAVSSARIGNPQMLVRAVLVLLVVLNVGVAVWWMTRVDKPMVAVRSAADMRGVAKLRLRGESVAAARPATMAESAATAVPTPAAASASPAIERCLAFGPFADRVQIDIARAVLQPQVSRLRERRVAVAPGPGWSDWRGWRVWIPPQSDRAAAQALAARIAAAGFDDYFIVASGDDANSVSLGRYAGEKAARGRESALRAAGFADVRTAPVGMPRDDIWIDVAATQAFAPAAALSALSGTTAAPIDCGSVPR